MAILTENQIKNLYFKDIGGFPSKKSMIELKDYQGENKVSIFCTQLDYIYSEREKKRILVEWIDFLSTNTKAFKSLHFNSRVPQKLFDAACCQEDLEELRFKWGAYKDLSKLKKLDKLKYLYIGSGASVQDITCLGSLDNLIVLQVENFKKIEDYTPLISLNKLEQLVISGPILGNTPIKDLDFLYKMKNLVSLWLPNTTLRRKYSKEEWERLRADLPNLHII
ncbi:MAG: hypothetical protein K0R00_2160 [Herbinix sp.]|jgi:Leucine-rich repeat (LRR) protein|nr:hypothetical protein [Herbinix sp.]